MITTLTYRRLFLGLTALAVTVLATVLIAEYGFDLKPCELCQWQRLPYVVTLLFGVLGIVFTDRSKVERVLHLLLIVTFIGSTVLATYHAGVEKKIFTGPTACSSQGLGDNPTLEELKAQIMGAPIVACNEPAWQWHGITMAGMNAVLSLVVLLLLVSIWIRKRRKAA
jgi:disulfide bond formation protein DsbB